MNTVREIERINQQELERGIAGTSASWHSEFSKSAWVFVGNLDHRLTEGDVICVLSQYGEIEDFNLPRDEKTGKSKGFAFCKYQDARSCILAVDNLIGVPLLDRPLRVDHILQYRLPKEILEKEESIEGTGHAYRDQELENDFNLEHGQDLFGSEKERKKAKKKQEKEAKRKRKEERAKKRAEREERRARKRARKDEHSSRRHDSSSSDDESKESEQEAEDPVQEVITVLEHFYEKNSEIKESHGIKHALAVYGHAVKAVDCVKISESDRIAVLTAALLHDVDDRKYFPNQEDCFNAKAIMLAAKLDPKITKTVIEMINLVSASKHGNNVPDWIKETEKYYYLIPRWSDRLEAVGKIGVLRCYQYNIEKGDPLFTEASPRAKTVGEVWEAAKPERFEEYQRSGGHSADMISHYYDKLLHVARPPKDCVRNKYLEEKAEEGVQPLIHVCLEYGRTGSIDEEFIRSVVID